MPGRCTESGSSSPGSTSSSTSATVTRPAMAHSGLKFREDLLKTRLPWRSPFHARTSPKSATMARSRTNSFSAPSTSKTLVSFGGEDLATVPSAL